VVVAGIWLFLPREAVPTPLFAAFIAGMVVLYGISLIDDVFSLSTTVRFVFQFGVAGLILWAFAETRPETVTHTGGWAFGWTGWFWAGLLGIGIVGIVNIYNFMDGIDGIAGVQAVIGGLAWTLVGQLHGMMLVSGIGLLVAAGTAGFLVLNWPPAKIFMGDAGSTVLGFTFAALPLLAATEGRGRQSPLLWLAAGVIVIWPFLADGSFTIFRRLTRRENILTAHRSHLYQRLVIAGRNHRCVTLVYGGLAALGAALAAAVTINPKVWLPVGLLAVSVSFLFLLRAVAVFERRKSTSLPPAPGR
jgi:UDP-N-acetylmuramyl pentapeptide phosphotransferase/UDP-N-acetylglucosamine-1-phosphate transferase